VKCFTPRKTVVRDNALDVWFRSWHETDMPTLFRNVRSQGQSRKHVLALSFSGFDPERTFVSDGLYRSWTSEFSEAFRSFGGLECVGRAAVRVGLLLPIDLSEKSLFGRTLPLDWRASCE